VLAAQEQGALGVVFVADVHNQTGPASDFQAQAANNWPTTQPRVERYTLKAWSDRIRIPVVQVSPARLSRRRARSPSPRVSTSRRYQTDRSSGWSRAAIPSCATSMS
jgi:hypothetical protein